jgi:hypothetical protein
MVTSTALAHLRGRDGGRLRQSIQANQSKPPNQPNVSPNATSPTCSITNLEHPAFNRQQAKTPTTTLLFAWPPSTTPVLIPASSLAKLRVLFRAAVGMSLLALTACYSGPNPRDCSQVEHKINPRLLQRVEGCEANPSM